MSNIPLSAQRTSTGASSANRDTVVTDNTHAVLCDVMAVLESRLTKLETLILTVTDTLTKRKEARRAFENNKRQKLCECMEVINTLVMSGKSNKKHGDESSMATVEAQTMSVSSFLTSEMMSKTAVFVLCK